MQKRIQNVRKHWPLLVLSLLMALLFVWAYSPPPRQITVPIKYVTDNFPTEKFRQPPGGWGKQEIEVDISGPDRIVDHFINNHALTAKIDMKNFDPDHPEKPLDIELEMRNPDKWRRISFRPQERNVKVDVIKWMRDKDIPVKGENTELNIVAPERFKLGEKAECKFSPEVMYLNGPEKVLLELSQVGLLENIDRINLRAEYSDTSSKVEWGSELIKIDFPDQVSLHSPEKYTDTVMIRCPIRETGTSRPSSTPRSNPSRQPQSTPAPPDRSTETPQPEPQTPTSDQPYYLTVSQARVVLPEQSGDFTLLPNCRGCTQSGQTIVIGKVTMTIPPEYRSIIQQINYTVQEPPFGLVPAQAKIIPQGNAEMIRYSLYVAWSPSWQREFSGRTKGSTSLDQLTANRTFRISPSSIEIRVAKPAVPASTQPSFPFSNGSDSNPDGTQPSDLPSPTTPIDEGNWQGGGRTPLDG